jgi:RNA polymerase sigma factor (sigma-70 family)
MWGDADTAIGGRGDRFPSTQVSLIEAAAGEPLAMERVAALYWKPVYKFIRAKFRKDNEAAKDLTQGFFAAALEREFFQRFDPSKAGFRTYLRLAVERFAANQHEAENRQKRGGGVEFAVLEDASVAGPGGVESPEEIYLQEWRRQLFALAVEDLRAECESAGKRAEWKIFEAYDLADDERPSYAALARRHGVAETSVTNYLAWARRRLRVLVTDRLRGVTSGERELREEMRRLWS